MELTQHLFFSGTSGLVLPIRQRDFPIEFAGASRLAYYASLFNSIEINSSFYKLPKAATVAKWAESVPPDFRFTFKVSKCITHNKGLEFTAADVEAFMQTVAHIGDRKGCLLVQLPPSRTSESIHQIEHLVLTIKDLDPAGSWRLAIEFRNNSWYSRATYDLLRRYDVVMVVHDMPASATPVLPNYGPALYLRFHGEDGKYRGGYEDEQLKATAGTAGQYMRNGTPVYAYFNNTMGDAVENLVKLNSFV
jgi:uncharacterized protein YecE (DUF72 family)